MAEVHAARDLSIRIGGREVAKGIGTVELRAAGAPAEPPVAGDLRDEPLVVGEVQFQPTDDEAQSLQAALQMLKAGLKTTRSAMAQIAAMALLLQCEHRSRRVKKRRLSRLRHRSRMHLRRIGDRTTFESMVAEACLEALSKTTRRS